MYHRTADVRRYLEAIRPLDEVAQDTVRTRPADWPDLLRHIVGHHRALAAALWARGEREEARRWFMRESELTGEIVRRRPADQPDAIEHAITLFYFGLITADRDEANAHFRAALHVLEPTAERPTNPAANVRRAWMLAECPHPPVRDPARAVELARKAVADDPGLEGGWEVLAKCLGEVGDYPEAVATLNHRRTGTGDRWAETQYGKLYRALWQLRSGRLSAALTDLKDADQLFTTTTEMTILSLRDRVWRETGGDPPPLRPAAPEAR